MSQSGVVPVIAGTVLFMVASWTDFYDGYYAKKHNIHSNFGKIMDPIADKFLVLTTFFIFSQRHLIAYWMFYLIFVREVTVTGSRILAIGRGQVLAAEKAGKLKTILQLFVIWITLLFIILQENGGFEYLPSIFSQIFFGIITILMFATIFLTVVSGVSYFWNNRKIVLASAINQ
jgi:CDP-diacylglycerol--glycerol-3-phosphate 3-phosphatidyltransferase